ncbi:hypothetical protein Trco_007247 [Trichoderma cornu-damae]|uniref:Uncharacterized protein n=1 Tax=Trichoderma cornu-damae TaxID=654480 RepID=A0A9P8TRG7_9HYPO|nr:hypothetical protein Trco_007247 [Trichoderma cornu-damae]
MATIDLGSPYDFLGEHEDKENVPCTVQVPPRPCRHTPRPAAVPTSMYRLGRRIRAADTDVGAGIYRDETAHDTPPPRRQYYGSNLPALPEIENGAGFRYALVHEMRPRFAGLMNDAYANGDTYTMGNLRHNHYGLVSIRERVTGLYSWNIGCSPLDVWLWVQDKGYHRTWSRTQKTGFREYLKWMGRSMVSVASRPASDPESELLNAENDWLVPVRFWRLGLPNLTLEKINLAYVYFIPAGADRPVVRRRDFTEEEQRIIDERWPEYWAPGEEGEPPVLERGESGEVGDETADEKYVFEGDNLIAF